jgi:hypothetical protein
MYSYPPEYLSHPVPVLAVYGLSEPEEKLVDVESTASSLNSSLLKLLTNKSEYTIYEATNNQLPPPFRVITVSKVPILFKYVFYLILLGLCFASETTSCFTQHAAASF